jgi:amino acid adenylation domain-containing protein
MTCHEMKCGEWISLVDLLRRRALEEPEANLFTFLPDGEDKVGATLTRGKLDRQACAIAARLQALLPDTSGARALLLYPPGLEFITAFFGCLYAGVVAIPAYLPRVNRPMTRLRSLVVDAQPCAVLTCASQSLDSLRWEAGVPELKGVRRLVTDVADGDVDDLAGRWHDPHSQHATLAFLQYTSGSTSLPKGVMITHGNLLQNSALIRHCFDSGPESRGVFWLPLFHDMGLIGGVIQTLYCGGASTLFSPVSFVQRPIRWLQTISDTRAMISGAPNFAYELCVEKTTPEQRALLDLSSWRVAFNGAEPIRPETLDRFADAFAPAGFRREAFLPCYGLAEATLLVSGGPAGQPPAVLSVDTQGLGRGEIVEATRASVSKPLAGSGKVADGHRVMIVDPETGLQCAEDRVGEIWVSGPSVAQGYWGRTEQAEDALRAGLLGDLTFLRTGDLGFLKDGVLFVTGRLKDMIILRGRNIYPQDIEWTAERCHPALRAFGAAAFAFEFDGEERLAVVQEIERNCEQNAIAEAVTAIRRALAEQHDIEVHAIRLIKMLSLPKTSSGKVQRRACREAFLAGALDVVATWNRQDAQAPGVGAITDLLATQSIEARQAERSNNASATLPGKPSRDSIAAWLADRVAAPLGIRASEVDVMRPLASFGIGSLQAVRLAADLEEWLGRKLTPTLAYDHPTIDALARFLADEPLPRDASQATEIVSADRPEPIAVIGIGCRFPGANSPAAFWKMLRDGADGVGPIPASRWDPYALRNLDIPRRGGFLESVDQFDADFFGISPREAVFVDPQHRLLLELAWEALEDGGQAPDCWAGAAVGVFVGIATNDYAQLQAMQGGASDGYRITGCAASIAANRISHYFDFRGPSLAIDTACSSSLVAVHLACRSLRDGESDLAMAGGVNLILLPEVLASFKKAGFLSADGVCKTFDSQADGYVRGEGAGMVVLKPLSRALADGDRIYAVIRGGAINQDGRSNGLTAPNRRAQEAVLRDAYARAGISPGQVRFIEGHGTGTQLGDPIELAALGAVLAEGREAGTRCAVGSVKTNIGHLEAAAGIAGLIKMALALHHRAIPQTLHFSKPNPHVAFDTLPLRVQVALEPLPENGRRAIAGVSSFGFGGTNAHLVLEEAPLIRNLAAGRNDSRRTGEIILPISAKSPAALWALACSIRDTLSDGSCQADMPDLAYTAGARRGHHDHRLAIVAASRDEIIEALDSFRRGEPHLSSVQGRRLPGRRQKLAFVFSGQCKLAAGALRALFGSEPAFRTAIEQSDILLTRHIGWSLAAELESERPSSRLADPAVARPVQFALQLGLAALWKSWGIVPDRLLGDGVGEVAAAHLSGNLSLDDAAQIVAEADRETAPFAEKLGELANEEIDVFLELGPHPVLASTIKACLGARAKAPLILPSLQRADSGAETLLSSAAQLYANGFDLEWSRVSPPGRFVQLPSYPWQRERFWIDDGREPHQNGATTYVDVDALGLTELVHRNGVSNGYHAASANGLSASRGGALESLGRQVEFPGTDDRASSIDSNLVGLSDLPADARRERLVEYFRDRVAAVLELAPEKVDLDRPLLNLGLDSLTAMDLKVEIDSFLGAAIPLSMLLESGGIRELAKRANSLLAATPARLPEAGIAPILAESEERLSHEQQLLWYAHQFTPNRAAYHITGAATIRAELEIDAFRRAFRHVVAQQEAMRTTFAVIDGKPVIHLLPASELVLRENEWLLIEDVASLSDREIKQKLAELADGPFDLERGPLFRLHLLSRSASEHVVLLVVHHIIADFWSTAVLVDDLGKAYSDELAGRAFDLSLPRSRYADFTRWQHTMVAGEEGERHWDYWRQQLSGPLPVLELPADFARPAVRSYAGATKHFYLDSALTRGIVNLSDSLGVSLYTTLLAAFQVLLGRLSGQDDIVVGSPVAGRTRPGFEGLIGYFVNLVPMRSNLSDNPRFDEFVGQVRRTVADGLEHQDFPFSLLVNRLQGNPDPSRSPLFQVMFAHQKAQRLDDQGLAPFALGTSGARLCMHGLAAESMQLERRTALFDLTMMTAREGDRLCVALEYSTDLFTSATVDRMAGYFRVLLKSIVKDPRQRLADCPLLGQPERHELLVKWAETLAVPYEDVAIHHRFERQVDACPDSIAVTWGEDALTYHDINRLANSLAHRLVELGVKPETVVGLYLADWPSRVIGVLGVLKAGGAYLPLDPDHPMDRVAAILQESGANVLVTGEHLRTRMSAISSNAIAVHILEESPVQDDPGNPSIDLHPDNLAYLVFTSGSTGRPKGVMISHRSAVAAACAWEAAYSLRFPPMRHLQAAGFSFDVFTGDWVRALTTGGTLVACPRSVLLDPAALFGLIRRERVECLELVPAVADALATHVEQMADQSLEGIRILAVGSDTLRGRLYGRLRRLLGPGGRVVNSYGLSEATIDSTYFEAARDDTPGDGPVPIGRPFAGTRAYVLDGRSEPVPVNVAGELYIGGYGLARGYVGSPRLTAERFVPNPHGRPGSRIYATGDRASWRSAGVLALLGRQDFQAKVRGFRVELAEVEAVLARHPEVHEAVVAIIEDSAGEKRLAAYVVPTTASRPTAADLRRWLKDRLPEPMLPSWYVLLSELPLSRNGKVTRSALPPPGAVEGDDSGTVYVPPRTTAEEVLAGIIGDLLRRGRVGIHDNFFEIGVDSIIGIQIVSRARQAGLALEPAHLFRHPNIAELAAAADSTPKGANSSDASRTAIAPFQLAPAGVDLETLSQALADEGGIEDLYPLTPVQEGMLFHTLADPKAGHYVEQFVCRLRGELDAAALERSWHGLIGRHPALRSSIHWSDFDQCYQIVHRGTDHPIDYQDWRGLTQSDQDDRLTDYLKLDRQLGFELSRPRLSRLSVFRLRDDLHQLVWSIHHVVIDGWCLSVLLHEMLSIYESVVQGRNPELKPSRPFRDYVAWLSQKTDELAQAHWTQVLRGFTAPTPLGLGGAEPAGCRSAEAHAELATALPADLTAALEELGRSRRLTLSTLLQGAWALLLSRYSGRTDVVFGVTVSGRPPELSGVESMVGMFINVVPMRVAVTEESDLLDWLRELQATMVELRRFEAIPISKVQAWSDVPAGMPLFESILIVQNLPFLASLQERGNRLGIESARYLERTHYPLSVTVVPGNELAIKISYDSRRFGADAIERSLAHLRTVLEAMASNPERRLVDLPWLTQSEQEQLIGQWERNGSDSGLDDVDLNQLTEMELDSLMAQLGSA